jgi:alkylation response protein AidB-like acyl-CoA dehydrogenase
MTSFTDTTPITMPAHDTDEQRALRETVRALGTKYGLSYITEKADAGEYPTELWEEAGRMGLIGVNLPEEYGGGGAGLQELFIVEEELSACGAGLLLLVVSPAICGTIISTFGTTEQKEHWLPGIASGDFVSAFAITEPDAGTNSHNLNTTAVRSGEGWTLRGQKTFISGVNQADAVLVVAQVRDENTGKHRPALFMVPTEAEGFSSTIIPTEVKLAEDQFQLFFDDIQLPADALVGDTNAGLQQLFTGLNPERIIATRHGHRHCSLCHGESRRLRESPRRMGCTHRYTPGDRASTSPMPHRS